MPSFSFNLFGDNWSLRFGAPASVGALFVFCAKSMLPKNISMEEWTVRKNWLKIAIALTLSLCIILALAACGGKDDGKDDGEAPPDPDAPPAPPQAQKSQKDETPIGFWVDLATQMRMEIPPAVRGFLDPTGKLMNAVVRGDRVGLICANDHVMNMVDKPAVREVAQRKASAILGRPITVKVVNREAERSKSAQMEQLMAFGREHSDIIKIKNN